MKKYFKDQKFLLIYQECEHGISVHNIPESVINDSKKSVVIAARGDEAKSGEHYLDNGFHFEKIKGDSASWYSIYTAYKRRSIDSNINGDESEPIKDVEAEKFLENLAAFVEGNVVTKLITLAFDEDGEIGGVEDANIKLMKRGGGELVVEFMLSKFIEESYRGWFYKSDGRRLEGDDHLRIRKDSDLDSGAFHDSLYPPFSPEEMSQLEEKWHYDFTTFDNLSAMDGIEYPEDPEYDSIKYLYQYKISKKKLEKYKKKIEIPYRVYEILTKEQKQLLSDQAHGILMDAVDDIGHDLFGLNFDNFAADERHRKSILESRQWGAELYGSLSTGGGNVYLGDGMSLDSNGNLVDD